MRLVHCSDIHLDHLHADGDVVEFCERVKATNVAGVIITGDISNSKALAPHLLMLERELKRPIWYTLGNHDMYGSSVAEVRKSMNSLVNGSQFLRYLPLTPMVPLTQKTALVGADGWYDAINGDVGQTRFLMNDWIAIQEFVPASGGYGFVNSMNRVKDMPALIAVAQGLARDGVKHVHDGIKQAVGRKFTNIVVATHFPPFAEACLWRGGPSEAGALPWYSSGMMGSMLRDAAKAFPNVQFTVLCGHTHGKATYQAAPNMVCQASEAQYGVPKPNIVLDVQ